MSDMTKASAKVGFTNHGDLLSIIGKTREAANRCLVRLMEAEGLHGIVPSHGDVLLMLFANETMSMAALAEAIGRDPSTVTALVKKLITAGYVEKSPSQADRRVNEVRLTERGRALKPAFERISTQLIETLTSGISSQELETACRILNAIRMNAENGAKS